MRFIIKKTKPVSLQFRLLMVYSYINCVENGIENTAEITGILKARCKLWFSYRYFHDKICFVYEDKRISFFLLFKGDLLNSVLVTNHLRILRCSGRPRSAVIKPKINRNQLIIKNDAPFIVRLLAQMAHLGSPSVHFIVKKSLKARKNNCLLDPPFTHWYLHEKHDETAEEDPKISKYKKTANKYEKQCTKTWLHNVHLLHDNAPAHKSTVV